MTRVALSSHEENKMLRGQIETAEHFKMEVPQKEPVAWMDCFGNVNRVKYRGFNTPLYAAPVMSKNTPDLDTSQERVQILEKNVQMLLEALKEAYEAMEPMHHEPVVSEALSSARAAIEKAEKL